MLSVRSGVLRVLVLPLALVAALALPCVASAQTTTGVISGTVVDPQGGVVPGATVTVVNEATSESRTALTDPERGTFQVTNLAPGTYSVRIALQGFGTFERKGVVVSSSERVSIGSVRLAVGGLTDAVSVTATGTQVNTEETQHGGVITRTQIEQIQVLGRDVTSLMRLLPGVRYEAPVDSMGGGFGVNMPSVGGLPADWGRVIIDGVVGNEVGNSGMNAQMVNLDAIAEVRLLNNSYRAEYGQSGGSQLQIVTRGGTSSYRGSLYYYGRHERFNSTEFFRARSQRLQGVDPFPPKYRFNTYGANVGGPVGKQQRKLFFFYSMEAPQVQRPQSVQTWRMPSALERQGDFSQTYNAQGQLINIRDPRKVGLACNAVSGGPGCFDGNIIPQSMINPNHMQAMLKLMPLPEYDPRTTQGNYNYDTEEVIDIPKLNNIARIDWRPTSNDSFSFTFKDWWQDQRGARITAGPSNWQWFFAHYKNTDRGFSGNYTKVLRSNLVWDTDFGSRRQTEVFYPLNDAEWNKASRTNAAFTVPQFHPELNPRDVLPKVTFGVAGGSPNFSYDSRLSDRGVAWLTSVRSNMTYLRGNHSFKAGIYYEKSLNSEGRGGVSGGAWAGDYNFSVDTANTLDTNYGYANALLGNFSTYTETDGFADVKGSRPTVEFYGQDTWKVSSTLTVDYGIRFLWFQPWASTGEGTRSASWDPDRYIAGGSPLLYRPVRINNVNLAQNPANPNDIKPQVYVGSFVPNTGDPYNGMVTNDEWPTYGIGFRVSQGIQPEGRVGVAWDITGSGKTSLHASLGRYHNGFVNANGLDVLGRQPPAQNNPILRYSTIALMQTPEAQAAFDKTPSAVTGFQHDAPTPQSLNYSVGIQRELGWGTVVDVTYAGSKTERIEVTHQYNDLPYGTNFIDLHPENINPQSGGVLPANFLRPYRGYGAIGVRQNTGETDYNSLQVQVNRRYIKGLQFALAYTLAKGYDKRVTSPYVPADQDWFWRAPTGGTQLHNLTISYTWDVPNGSSLWDHPITRGALDGWQLSGNTAFVSGDWVGVGFSTTDNFDFYGGGSGGRIVLTGIDPMSGDNRDPNPDGTGSYVNPAAFARPSGRFDLGNAPARFIRLPWIRNTDLSLFKNFQMGGGRRIQIRWEMYNVFNTVNWSGINLTAQFNPAGELANAAAFGKATSARDPRIMQGAIRFSF